MDDDLVNEQCKGLLANATERWADDMPQDLTGANPIFSAYQGRIDQLLAQNARLMDQNARLMMENARLEQSQRVMVAEGTPPWGNPMRPLECGCLVIDGVPQCSERGVDGFVLDLTTHTHRRDPRTTETIAGVTYLGQPWGGDYRQRTDEIVVRKPSVIFREIVNSDMRPLGVQMRLAPEIVRRNVLSETPTIRRGEFITCEAGHLVCEAIGDIRHGQVGYAANLGAWRLETPPQPGDVDPRCPCGALYFKLSPGPSLHVKGRGWV